MQELPGVQELPMWYARSFLLTTILGTIYIKLHLFGWLSQQLRLPDFERRHVCSQQLVTNECARRRHLSYHCAHSRTCSKAHDK